MLSASRYLLGVAEIALLAGFAWLGASRLCRRLLPDFSGAPAHLATAVLALALLLLTAELFGSFGLFEPLPYLVAVGAIGACLGTVGRKTFAAAASPAGGADQLEGPGGGGTSCTFSAIRSRPASDDSPKKLSGAPTRSLSAATGPAGRAHGPSIATLIALLIAAAAVIHFAADVRLKLGTGMTGFDSTWYHGPLAANFFQSGNTWDLHFIAPQFLSWFYPANAEIFHAVGMLAFHRDLLSPLLNLGWLIGCLFAVWCIGRPFGVAPWSLALGAIALSVPALADQAGEARNDLAATFFLLAAAAIALNARAARPEGGRGLPTGALAVAGLAAGLAAGTKLNFLPPAAVLVVGLAVIAPRGGRWRALGVTGLAALAGGGYWYLRNLAHSGSPLPWLRHLGPISLPGPTQALGGRQGHSVLSYLGDGSVWSQWFLPGLHDGLSALWPLLAALALAGLLLCLGRRGGPVLRVLALAGLAAGIAWLVSPTSAEGPPGVPRGFESGLRYLAPLLALGLALLPATPPLRDRLRRWRLGTAAGWGSDAEVVNGDDAGSAAEGEPSDVALGVGRASAKAVPRKRFGVAAATLALLAVIAIGYPVERHYLRSRYAHPEFTTKGLDAAFSWARSISGARIATTATRQYPLFGTDLSNRVQFVGLPRPHGGFVALTTCRQWRTLINAGHYDYAVVTRDRIESGKPAYPPQAAWTEAPGTTVLLRKPPTVVFKLTTPLAPSACP